MMTFLCNGASYAIEAPRDLLFVYDETQKCARKYQQFETVDRALARASWGSSCPLSGDGSEVFSTMLPK